MGGPVPVETGETLGQLGNGLWINKGTGKHVACHEHNVVAEDTARLMVASRVVIFEANAKRIKWPRSGTLPGRRDGPGKVNISLPGRKVLRPRML